MLSYLSLFLLIFDLAIPPVKFIGSAPFSLVISLSVLLVVNRKLKLKSQVKKFTAPFFIFYLVIMCFAVFRILFSGELDYFLSISKSLVIFTSATFYLLTFGCDRINDRLINIFFVNGIVCLVAGSFPAILDIVYIFKSGMREVGFIPYRNAFLAGSGYFGMASAYAVIILLCAHKLIKDGLSVSFAIKFLVILIAGVLAGRTVFVGIAISFIYIMSQSVKYTGLGVLLVAGLVAIIFSVDALSVYSGWMFEFISFDGDSVALSRTSSTDELYKMYFMPPNDSTWLWGDGRYVDGAGYYMHTDAGYMRNLFFGGLPFVIAVIAYACLFAFKSKSFFFTLFFLPLAFALHYKGAFILNNPAGVPILTLLAFWFYYEKIKKLKAGIV
ncbi:TPA: hypothetical protein ACMDOI_003028 [Vibrio cholerae]